MGIAFLPIMDRYLLLKYSCKLESVWGGINALKK